MTGIEIAASMRRCADVFENIGGTKQLNNANPAMLEEEQALGAAVFLCYLRDLFTVSDKEKFSRDEILVILEICRRDTNVFPAGIGQLVWNMENDDE